MLVQYVCHAVNYYINDRHIIIINIKEENIIICKLVVKNVYVRSSIVVVVKTNKLHAFRTV